jgi:signal transduction histidine kinase
MAGGPETRCPVVIQSERLLHDARNLMGALGLYCDLLSMPDVLKPEHRHYAEDVRLLGERSTAMIQRLMEHIPQPLPGQDGEIFCQLPSSEPPDGCQHEARNGKQSWVFGRKMEPGSAAGVSLRSVVERRAGLISRVAGGQAIQISYGAAASVPIRLEEEAAERILVNLVRNAAAALNQGGIPGELDKSFRGAATKAQSYSRSYAQDPLSFGVGRAPHGRLDATPWGIRIGVGLLSNRAGDAKPWPFQRVRLTVEDSGCGMSAEQVERLLSGKCAHTTASHGIGFSVVRELVAASGGELRVMSTPGAGTWVQIDWPMVVAADTFATKVEFGRGFETGLSC